MQSGVHVTCFYMHARRVVSRFDAKGHQELSGYDLYKSLLTCVAHMDLVQTSLSSLTPVSCLGETRHNRDIFPANTMAYDILTIQPPK